MLRRPVCLDPDRVLANVSDAASMRMRAVRRQALAASHPPPSPPLRALAPLLAYAFASPPAPLARAPRRHRSASFHPSASSVDRVTLLGAFDPATFDGIVTSAAVPMRGGSSVHFPALRWGSSHGVSIWVRPQHTPKLSKKKMPALHSNSSSMQTILATRPHGTAALARLLQLELGDDGVLVVHVAGGRGARARGVVLPTGAWTHVVLNVERGKAALFVNGSAFALQQPTRGSAVNGVQPSAFRAAVEWTVGCLFIPSTGTDDAQEDGAPGSCTQPLTADVDGLQILARPWSVGELRAVANRRKKIDGVPVTDVFFHEDPKPKAGGGGEGGGETQHQSDEL